MIQPINHDPILLGRVSEPATEADRPVAEDLLDTLKANADRCVGMAANMIGVLKRIIVFDDNGKPTVMYNPSIVRRDGVYEAEEGCLSLDGTRKTKRYRRIKVQYQDDRFRLRTKNFTDWTAQIIQHEIDHCNGILI